MSECLVSKVYAQSKSVTCRAASRGARKDRCPSFVDIAAHGHGVHMLAEAPREDFMFSLLVD